MNLAGLSRRLGVLLVTTSAAVVFAGSAFGHATISPTVAPTGDQIYTLAVLGESEDAATTKVELTPPDDFTLLSVRRAPGWTAEAPKSGEGEEAAIQKMTWTGGDAEPGETVFFEFLGFADEAKTFSFEVRQTYADGEVVDWAGPESSDEPAARVELKSSLGGGGGSTAVEIVALALGAIALVVAVFALVGSSGGRPVA